MSDPRVLFDAAANDDAAVFEISSDRALVATVDFFTPIVDDAYTFGAIAAANAFSDVYAMGGRPLFALNVVGWPRDPDMLDLLGDTLRGGADIAARAGAFIIGGHSIDDKEPKYGLIAIGEVHPAEIISNAGAKEGDVLVLTKPIGTGILSTALKRDLIGESGIAEAVRAMTTLNDAGAAAIRATGDAVHAATDVTGFGLLGHLRNILSVSGVGARISVDGIPLFSEARRLTDAGAVPGGTKRNLDAAEEFTTWDPGIADADRFLLADAQTSGGLLIAVAADHAEQLVSELAERKTPAAAVIGEITGSPAGTVSVTPNP